MTRKTDDVYYKNETLVFKIIYTPQPQEKTSSEFQAIIIHYDKVMA
jgi:hypothetical protein